LFYGCPVTNESLKSTLGITAQSILLVLILKLDCDLDVGIKILFGVEALLVRLFVF